MEKEKTTRVLERLDRARHDWGWEPHPTQKDWLLAEARVKVAACGRRWGKTEAAGFDAATFALEFPKSVQMIVSPTYDQSRLIFSTVERLIMNHNEHKIDARCVKTPYPQLTLGNGSIITARTADDDGRNLRGHWADRVIVDEAAYVRDAVIDEVVSPMLADKNGQLIMISTPFGRNHFYRAFMRGQEQDDRYAGFRFPSWENPHISREYIESQREILTERQFSVEYEAQFLDDQNAVFSWSDVQAAVSGDRGPGAGDGEEQFLVAGIDWARYSDYTAVVVVDACASPMRVVEVDRFNNISWEAQANTVTNLIQRYGVQNVLMDQTSIGDPMLERVSDKVYERDLNVAVEGLQFTNQSKREIIDRLTLLLSNRQIKIPNHEQLIKELQHYEYELSEAGNLKMNAKRGYHDDLVIALALAAKAAASCPGSLRILTSEREK